MQASHEIKDNHFPLSGMPRPRLSRLVNKKAKKITARHLAIFVSLFPHYFHAKRTNKKILIDGYGEREKTTATTPQNYVVLGGPRRNIQSFFFVGR